jgi:hypothetical protein
LSLGQFSPAGKLKFDENMVNAYTYSDIVVTLEPENDKDPKQAWSQSIAAYWATSTIWSIASITLPDYKYKTPIEINLLMLTYPLIVTSVLSPTVAKF